MKPPTHTLRPAEWSVWADYLDDAGAPHADVLHARQIALALARRPRLVLTSPGGTPMRTYLMRAYFACPGWGPAQCLWADPARERARMLAQGLRDSFVTAILADALATPWHLPRPRPPHLVRAWFATLPSLLEPGPAPGV